MSTHTPGPWIAEPCPESKNFDWRVLGPFLYIGIDTENAEADARLIAAAPDLLEALRACLPYVDHVRAISGGDGDITAQMARAALAKAEGGA